MENRWKVYPISYGISLLGFLLATISFFFLPWIRLGPAGTFSKNARWLVTQTRVIEEIKKVPELKNFLATITMPKEEDIIGIFNEPSQKALINLSLSEKMVNGWKLALLARPYHPNLTLSIWGMLAGAILTGIGAIYRLLRQPYQSNRVMRYFGVLVVICSLYLISQMTFLDTLGAPSNFWLRILTTFLESEISIGPWVMLMGCGLVFVSTLVQWIPESVNTNIDDLTLSEYR